MTYKHQYKDTRSDTEKLNALEYDIKAFAPHVRFYLKFKREAIKQGIDNLFDYEDYL